MPDEGNNALIIDELYSQKKINTFFVQNAL